MYSIESGNNSLTYQNAIYHNQHNNTNYYYLPQYQQVNNSSLLNRSYEFSANYFESCENLACNNSEFQNQSENKLDEAPIAKRRPRKRSEKYKNQIEFQCKKEFNYVSSNASSASSECAESDEYFTNMYKAYQAGTLSKTKYKRLIANERERRRMHGLNSAFENLRAVLPDSNGTNYAGSNESSSSTTSKHYSKYETLRTALDYIISLRQLLNCDSPVCCTFTSITSINKSSIDSMNSDDIKFYSI